MVDLDESRIIPPSPALLQVWSQGHLAVTLPLISFLGQTGVGSDKSKDSTENTDGNVKFLLAFPPYSELIKREATDAKVAVRLEPVYVPSFSP